MLTTIDKAGRVVIPAALRERLGLTAGTQLKVSLDDGRVRLERVASAPRLIKVGRRLVARPTAAPAERMDIDVASLVEEERSRWP
jgi:AbrB family looped-hinge helix DNA binding protein